MPQRPSHRATISAPPSRNGRPRGPSAPASRVADVPTDGKPKYYVLEMFPYPVRQDPHGPCPQLHLGDVVARYKRARGFAVLHPMGWDAFGLPAENAARERGIHPAKWTYENIATMRAELQRMGLSLDWAREFATCDPEYYRHQQKLFLDFLARRPGRAQGKLGQLGSGRRHRAGQRAGDRRQRLALRRAGGEEAAQPMVLLRSPNTRRNCWPRWTRWTAGRNACG